MLLKVTKKCFYPEFQVLTNQVQTSAVYLHRRLSLRRSCLYTNRSRAVLSISRSSRHKIRSFIRLGVTYSLKKTAW